jgi:hypothetical protein
MPTDDMYGWLPYRMREALSSLITPRNSSVAFRRNFMHASITEVLSVRSLRCCTFLHPSDAPGLFEVCRLQQGQNGGK